MTRVEIHKQICGGLNDLYRRKNSDYGGAFQTLRSRFPQSTIMRLWDKLLRLEQLTQPGYEAQVTDEKVEDTLRDMANYAIMELTEREYERQNQNQPEPCHKCCCESYADDDLETVWSLANDGITERFNLEGGFNDIELSRSKTDGSFQLWVETLISFPSDASLIRHLERLETALWKYTYSVEPGGSYEIQWDESGSIADGITGMTVTEVATKFSYLVNSYIRHLKEHTA